MDLRARFWYCPLCGYMFFGGGASGVVSCPMCSEDAVPCWECIRTGVFDMSWCVECDDREVCRTAPGSQHMWRQMGGGGDSSTQ